ncbi:MAG: aspartate-semialdehyde dehydrogenase [Myxococcales bacterium]|nr:aspartate-semialdehyde dehydrogenase [Myxococcales bacterium]
MKVGIIGWRGMVGSVLIERMKACGDFEGLTPTFFSTSAAGGEGPEVDGRRYRLADAFDLDALADQEALITCQGGSYTLDVHPRLRAAGWQGYFIDAARALRMEQDSVLILDPVNRQVIDRGLEAGLKTFCGPNCTVSLLLMALDGLFAGGHVEWVSSMTYQAASGGGARHMRELVAQMAQVGDDARALLADPASSALQLDASVSATLRSEGLPRDNFGVPLAGSLIPWIDAPVDDGQTREEWKAHAEGNKILGSDRAIPFDGLCVRVGAMRCHSQGVTLKLKSDLPLDEIHGLLGGANEWVDVVENSREPSERLLSPAAISGSLKVAVGRVRKMRMGPQYLSLFTVGDQLLWGAAEPLRRMLAILRGQL